MGACYRASSFCLGWLVAGASATLQSLILLSCVARCRGVRNTMELRPFAIYGFLLLCGVARSWAIVCLVVWSHAIGLPPSVFVFLADL